MIDEGQSYRVGLQTAEFKGAHENVNELTQVTLTGAELVHAAVTVGTRVWAPPVINTSPWFTANIRTSILQAYLDHDTLGYLVRSEEFKTMDPSEKAMVSYHHGMTIANALSTRLLGASYLAHVDVWGPALGLATTGTRPDLVGQDQAGNWLIVEAKGRGDAPSPQTKVDAKAQAQSVKQVTDGGVEHGTLLNVASISYFTQIDRLRASFADPEPEDDAQTLELPEGAPAVLRERSLAPVLEGALSARQSDNVLQVLIGPEDDAVTYDVVAAPFTGYWLGLPTSYVDSGRVGDALAAVDQLRSADVTEAAEPNPDQQQSPAIVGEPLPVVRSADSGSTWAIGPLGLAVLTSVLP